MGLMEFNLGQGVSMLLNQGAEYSSDFSLSHTNIFFFYIFPKCRSTLNNQLIKTSSFSNLGLVIPCFLFNHLKPTWPLE